MLGESLHVPLVIHQQNCIKPLRKMRREVGHSRPTNKQEVHHFKKKKNHINSKLEQGHDIL